MAPSPVKPRLTINYAELLSAGSLTTLEVRTIRLNSDLRLAGVLVSSNNLLKKSGIKLVGNGVGVGVERGWGTTTILSVI